MEMYNKFRIHACRVGFTITDLTPPHCCACSNPGSGFHMSYAVGCLLCSVISVQVIVRFVNLSGIDDYHCLNFLVIII
jgi:hypothetical protein